MNPPGSVSGVSESGAWDPEFVIQNNIILEALSISIYRYIILFQIKITHACRQKWVKGLMDVLPSSILEPSANIIILTI